MKDFFEHIISLEENRENLVLATILNKSGSAPREEGAKMLVKKDFSIVGTIGGGLLEAMTIKETVRVFANREYFIKDFALNNKDASSLGMVCGGDVRVLLEYIDYNDVLMMDIYRKAIELKQNRTDFVMITKMPKDNKYITSKEKWICTRDELIGIADMTVQEIAGKLTSDFMNTKIADITIGGDIYLIEPFFHFESVYIFGAGHVALKIAALTKMLGFYTIVIDDREEFANSERFPNTDEVKVIPSFMDLHNHVIIDSNSYIIIVTRGHSYDKEVLAQMLKTEAKYIGMIGSRSKKSHTYNLLKEEGFIQEDLDRVYCPIGLNINADTPEEIAVSIAAELVQVRRS